MSHSHRIYSADLPDSILVDLVADGDTDAFALVFQRYGNRMRAIALRYTRNAADADDVIQEALVYAWQKIDTLRSPENLASWLMTITVRKAIDHIRRRKNHLTLDTALASSTTASGTPETQMVINEGVKHLDLALATLPSEQAQVWLLRHATGMSYFEIGRELKIPTSTVRGRLARARQALLTKMEEWT